MPFRSALLLLAILPLARLGAVEHGLWGVDLLLGGGPGGPGLEFPGRRLLDRYLALRAQAREEATGSGDWHDLLGLLPHVEQEAWWDEPSRAVPAAALIAPTAIRGLSAELGIGLRFATAEDFSGSTVPPLADALPSDDPLELVTDLHLGVCRSFAGGLSLSLALRGCYDSDDLLLGGLADDAVAAQHDDFGWAWHVGLGLSF